MRIPKYRRREGSFISFYDRLREGTMPLHCQFFALALLYALDFGRETSHDVRS